MDDNRKDSPRTEQRRNDPTQNQSGDLRDAGSPVNKAEEMRQTQEHLDVHGDQSGRLPQNGMGVNGEFRVGKVTIAARADGKIVLRREGVGEEKEVAEQVLEGLLHDNFFVEKFDSSGDLKGDKPAKAGAEK